MTNELDFTAEEVRKTCCCGGSGCGGTSADTLNTILRTKLTTKESAWDDLVSESEKLCDENSALRAENEELKQALGKLKALWLELQFLKEKEN